VIEQKDTFKKIKFVIREGKIIVQNVIR